MDIEDISDDELHYMTLDENEDVKNYLLKKYKYIINASIKKYKKYAKCNNVDIAEMYSEGLYGFTDAINCYSQDKEASFKTFATICVERRISKYIRKCNNRQMQLESNMYSLDYMYGEGDRSLISIVSDDTMDPLHSITDQETLDELNKEIKKVLSESEYLVYRLMVNGFSYKQIATMVDKSPKQIDNAMQRIKHKIRNLVKVGKNA